MTATQIRKNLSKKSEKSEKDSKNLDKTIYKHKGINPFLLSHFSKKSEKKWEKWEKWETWENDI